MTDRHMMHELEAMRIELGCMTARLECMERDDLERRVEELAQEVMRQERMLMRLLGLMDRMAAGGEM